MTFSSEITSKSTAIGKPDLANEADLAQAFKELSKGEKTASAMEHQLTQLETKIDDLLASAEEQSQDAAAQMLSGRQEVVGEEAVASR